MIVEINAPQLRYIAGAIGRDEYLSQALITYLRSPGSGITPRRPNVFWVWRIAPTSMRRRYPRYQSNCAFRPWTAPEVENQLRTASFDLVGGSARRSSKPTWLRHAPPDKRPREVYRDPNFVIYRLQ